MLQLEHGDLLYLGQEGRDMKYGFIVDIPCMRQIKSQVIILPSLGVATTSVILWDCRILNEKLGNSQFLEDCTAFMLPLEAFFWPNLLLDHALL